MISNANIKKRSKLNHMNVLFTDFAFDFMIEFN